MCPNYILGYKKHFEISLFEISRVDCTLALIIMTLRSAMLHYTPGPEVVKLFSCSTQLSMKFFLLINVKMLTIILEK